MEGTLATSLAVLVVAVGALAIWMIVRLVNRPHNRESGGIGRWLLHSAANSFKSTRIRQIPRERKMLYCVGLTLIGVGLVLILSPFARLIASFGTIDNFEDPATFEVFRAFGGLILLIVGRFLWHVAANGWTGLGILLNSEWPKKVADLQNGMNVRTARDALWDVDAVRRIEVHLQSTEHQASTVCRKCHAANTKSSQFCNQCGSAL
jgi:ribosomal protein L40E